jgi:hypothetical protein
LGASISFQASVTSLGSPAVAWTWSSSLDGNFGTLAYSSVRLSAGRHVIKVRVVNSNRTLVAEDRVIVDVGMYLCSAVSLTD